MNYVLGLGTSSSVNFLLKSILLLEKNQHSKIYKIEKLKITNGVCMINYSRFYNICVCINVCFSINAFWFFLKNVELKLGRIKIFKNSLRVIDVDILMFGNIRKISTKFLLIPHICFFQRKIFVNQILLIIKKE